MHIFVENKFPHYYPSTFGGPQPDSKYLEPPMKSVGFGDISYYPWPEEGTYEDLYAQVADFWNVLDATQRENMCTNIAASLEKVKEQKIVDMMLESFGKCSSDWEKMVRSKLQSLSKKKTDNEILCQSYAKKLLDIRGQPPSESV